MRKPPPALRTWLLVALLTTAALAGLYLSVAKAHVGFLALGIAVAISAVLTKR